ncbi:hypothetical protein KGQ20_40140 [Catenulispora sp. NF23]|uniref:Uncharacterized protein n=1 Tax=Catenulispora pinistramenti TaxID=2705254 RepID=A0ABS5KR36_9ACTN|nr:hypothetical protein [Catenulispora pinistramenti]MBS2538976.1 hypothetical protein [Catenulispora pinistramenti]MBS2548507.1 hypothetical protein [Catenulispora pinistramenti]
MSSPNAPRVPRLRFRRHERRDEDATSVVSHTVLSLIDGAVLPRGGLSTNLPHIDPHAWFRDAVRASAAAIVDLEPDGLTR